MGVELEKGPRVDDRVRLGVIENPVRALLHGSGAVVSTIGVIVLLTHQRHAALFVYGVTLVGMYSASTLYHAVPWRTAWKARMQKVDHTFIYLLVAGTFTALVAGSMQGAPRWWALMILWVLAAVGIGRVFSSALRRRWVFGIELGLGGLALLPVGYLFRQIAGPVQLLTLAGGIVYLVGVTMFVRGWPRLFPRIFGFHETFHVLVIVASLAHYLAIWQIWVRV